MPHSQSPVGLPGLPCGQSGFRKQQAEGCVIASQRAAGWSATEGQSNSKGEESMSKSEIVMVYPASGPPGEKHEVRRDKDGLHKRRGIWHYKLKIGGKWKEYSTKKTNYQEAKKVRNQALLDQEQGRLPNDFAKLRFEKAAELWLEERKQFVANKTHRIDKERLKPLGVAFGGTRLCDITADMIRTYQVKRTQKVGTRTVNLETKVLRMLLRRAKMWARIADDFKPLKEKKRGPGRALTNEQEKKLFEVAASRDSWQLAYWVALVAANTTARGCELRGLHISDVNLIEKTLRIRRASTKTDAGERIIPLNADALWACARLLERARKIGATEPEHYLMPTALYRHTKKEDPLRTATGFDLNQPMKTWRTAWRNLVAEAGLPGFRFHDLRHHAITKMAENPKITDQILMSISGHVSREMLEHYSHVRMAAKREAVAALERKAEPEKVTAVPVEPIPIHRA
jgi:integrase